MKKDPEASDVPEGNPNVDAFISEVSLEDDDIFGTGGGNAEFYKGQAGKIDRIWIPTSRIMKAGVHYAGTYYFCKSTKDKEAICCQLERARAKAEGEEFRGPKKRFGTPIVHFVTDRKGEMQKPFDYVIKFWIFGGDKMFSLKELKDAGVEINQVDLRVSCKKEKQQDLSFLPMPFAFVLKADEKLVAAGKPSLAKKIIDDVNNRFDSMKRFFGKNLSDDEIKGLYSNEEKPGDDDEVVNLEEIGIEEPKKEEKQKAAPPQPKTAPAAKTEAPATKTAAKKSDAETMDDLDKMLAEESKPAAKPTKPEANKETSIDDILAEVE